MLAIDGGASSLLTRQDDSGDGSNGSTSSDDGDTSGDSTSGGATDTSGSSNDNSSSDADTGDGSDSTSSTDNGDDSNSSTDSTATPIDGGDDSTSSNSGDNSTETSTDDSTASADSPLVYTVILPASNATGNETFKLDWSEEDLGLYLWTDDGEPYKGFGSRDEVTVASANGSYVLAATALTANYSEIYMVEAENDDVSGNVVWVSFFNLDL